MIVTVNRPICNVTRIGLISPFGEWDHPACRMRSAQSYYR